MAESHTKGDKDYHSIRAHITGDGRSPMARVSDSLPFKPYTYHGETTEPPAVTAALERHRAINAEIERRTALAAGQPPALTPESMPDPWPDREWHDELTDGTP